jgi:hypothetical protein
MSVRDPEEDNSASARLALHHELKESQHAMHFNKIQQDEAAFLAMCLSEKARQTSEQVA